MWLGGLAIAVLLGYCLVRLWLPDEGGGSPWTVALHISLGTGLGIGITSYLHFLLMAGGVASVATVAGCEVVALGAAGAFVLGRRRGAASASSADGVPYFSWNWLTGLGLAGMLALFVAGFVNASELNPQGGWDAFAIWNLRARFLIHTETWKYAVTTLPVGTHTEYPLLLSSAIARGWTYGADVSAAVPIALAFLFPVALVMLLVSALAKARGASLGLIAGIVLLANPSLLTQAPSQYADVPLAYFFLAALALMVLGVDAARPGRFLLLAGVFAGLAAWTKNEGMLLVAALGAALLVTVWRAAGWRAAVRQAGFFLAGALPGLLLVLWFKLAVAPPDPLAGQMTASVGQKLASGGRWLQVAGGFLKQAWELYIFPAPPLAILTVACGVLRLRRLEELAVAPSIAVAIVLAGYFAIFMVTGYDLEWLLGTALERLYLHVWPALVLAAFLLMRRPEDWAILSSPPKTKKGRQA